ncbi:MAG: YtxH domain-containing protein [Candidatus Atribacteria bacterium]|nr:YtxH domain-containing protein [Candidatus Atribacteria bacterium]
MSDKKGCEIIGSFLVGALLGLTLGVLYAPRSGEKTRRLIEERALEIEEETKEIGTNIKEKVENKAEEIKEKGKKLKGGKNERRKS